MKPICNIVFSFGHCWLVLSNELSSVCSQLSSSGFLYTFNKVRLQSDGPGVSQKQGKGKEKTSNCVHTPFGISLPLTSRITTAILQFTAFSSVCSQCAHDVCCSSAGLLLLSIWCAVSSGRSATAKASTA